MKSFTDKKINFFENISMMCLVFNKYVFILLDDLFEMDTKLYHVKMVLESRFRVEDRGGRRNNIFS
jgi:regulator of sigma D